MLSNVNEGDTVVATGKIAQTAGMEELVVQKIKLETSGDIPKPRDVWTTDLIGERFAGQLVRATGEIIATHGEKGAVFVLRDSGGEIPLIIPAAFLTWNQGQLNYALWKGGKAEVIGIAMQDKALEILKGNRLLHNQSESFNMEDTVNKIMALFGK